MTGLARRLVQENLLDEQAAFEAVEAASREKALLASYLVANKLVAASDVARVASQEFGLPLFDLSVMDLEAAPIKLVDEKLIRQHHALPLFKRGNRLFVAVSDPTNLTGLDEIKFHTGITTEAILVEEDKLNKAIDQALEAADTSMSDLLDEDLDNL
ncbi:MAG TPA: type IV-A pilus assembly ATPase PilB, partial [Thiolapillus brandeum]|nr:type IV-A pilus assembly ATPase PilB [Thiolapillus brandeum]